MKANDPLQPFHEAVIILGLEDALRGFLDYEFINLKGWLNWWCSMGGKLPMQPGKAPTGFNTVARNMHKNKFYNRVCCDPHKFLQKMYVAVFEKEPPNLGNSIQYVQ